MKLKQNIKAYIFERYQSETGKTDFTAEEVAKFAIERLGLEVPEPPSKEKILAKDLAKIAREETRIDKHTGQPYRKYHCIKQERNGQFCFVWFDIEKASRLSMQKSAYSRREQMADDANQMVLDLDHWNRSNPDKEPIIISLDVTPDVRERLANKNVDVTSLVDFSEM